MACTQFVFVLIAIPCRAWTYRQSTDQQLAFLPTCQCAGVKFIRFSEIIAGQGPVDRVSHSYVGSGVTDHKRATWAHMCDPYPFVEMREVAYRNLGLQVRPPHPSTRTVRAVSQFKAGSRIQYRVSVVLAPSSPRVSMFFKFRIHLQKHHCEHVKIPSVVRPMVQV